MIGENMTVIKKCGCVGNPDHSSKYQDGAYGKGMRVHNVSLSGKVAKCTVCGKEQQQQQEKNNG